MNDQSEKITALEQRIAELTEQESDLSRLCGVMREENWALTAKVKDLEAQEPVGWTEGEGWERLAWHLCAEENGEDSCNELIWEGGSVPEPWGDRWMKYEGEARRMIALVRTHVMAHQPNQVKAVSVPPPPWMKPGQFFGGRPERAMEIDATDFYGITEAIHHALEMIDEDTDNDASPLDPKRSRRLAQALMAAWLIEYPQEVEAHGIKGGAA